MSNLIYSWCCNKDIKPLTNITGDYYDPIINASKSNPYLKKYIPEKKEKELEQNDNNDIIMNYYLKSTINFSIIVIPPIAYEDKPNLERLLDLLNKNGKVHYKKIINVNFRTMYNIVYSLYANIKFVKTNDSIINRLYKQGFKDTYDEREIMVIVYEHKNSNNPIVGSGSLFKTELRKLFTDNEKLLPFYLHISDTNNEVYEYSNIFFNKNTMKFYKTQRSWNVSNFEKSINLVNKYKEFIYNYSINELEKSLVFSSGILFSYGIRELNDIDVLLLKSDSINPSDIDEINKKNKDLMDISYEGSEEFNEIWIKELNDRAKLFGASDYQELILNPDYYYYYMGLKFLKLQFDIMIRFRRSRPAQITDLLIMRQMYNLKYQIKIPEKTKVFNEELKIDVETPVNKNKFLDTVRYYLETRYFIRLNVDQVEKWINNNIKGGKYIKNIKNIKNKRLIYTGNNLQNLDKKDEYGLYLDKNYADEKYVYPLLSELKTMGYIPNIRILNDRKPFLYEGQTITLNLIKNMCQNFELDITKHRSLRVFSFNVHNFITRCNSGINPIFDESINPFFRSRNIDGYIELFDKLKADVICLQEVVPILKDPIEKDIEDYEYIRDNFNFEYLNSKMESLGYKYKVISSTLKGHFMEEENKNYYYLGNAIYSKLELFDTQIYQYNFMNRNFITTTINFNNKKIHIVNTHFEYYGDVNKLILQSKLLIDKLKELYDLNNIIMAGDFNINLYNKGIGRRYKDWENKVRPIIENFNSTSSTSFKTNFNFNDTTDFILLSKKSVINKKFSLIIKSNLSDHFGVITDFL
jgi:endonuclease/exonuclease/phosphatase family metal-dependent hydrolase